MTEPRRHHLVPAFYLRGFGNEKGQVGVITRDLKKAFTASALKIAVETDFYAIETKDGPSQEMEKLLSAIEDEGARALRNLIGGAFPPSAEDRAAFSQFVAFQWLRGRDHREAWSNVLGQLMKMAALNISKATIREYFEQKEGRQASE
jgi:hypothetical protein